MLFNIIKSTGIAHHSYFIASRGKAAVIDPRRDIDPYLRLADDNELEIIYIFETHRNEDFVIGSLELAQNTDAKIFHGTNFDFKYGTGTYHGDKFKLDKLELEVIETPGHTLESISLVLRDLNISYDPIMIFSGDVIFAGETGRVDFYGVNERPKMAELLYESIFSKILNLGDQTIICPAHGAGSVCGADIREQDLTTIGYEKKTNPSIKFKTKKDFIQSKVSEELYTPPYFKKMEDLNQKGAPILQKIPSLKPIKLWEFKEKINQGIQVLDVRNPTSFASAHVKGSVNIWQDGVPAFAGWFLNYDDPIIIVDDQNKREKIIKSLLRIGYDNVYGYLPGGFPSWYLNAEEVGILNTWTVQDLLMKQKTNEFHLIDVRKLEDRKTGYIEDSEHVYVGMIPKYLEKIPKDMPVVLYCDSGYKSTIAASILKINEFTDVTTVLGGISSWKKAKYPLAK